MYRILFILSLCIGFMLNGSCTTVKSNKKKSTYHSGDRTSFDLQFADDEITNRFFADSTLYGSECTISLQNIKGLSALAIKTNKEFSDAFIDLEKLFGYTIDFSQAKYISLKILVPNNSWITALKFNFKDNAGNFGGCDEFANNFYGNYNQWIDVIIPMYEKIPHFKNWHGKTNPLANTRFLSVNPYNAHQADSSVIYINSIRLSKEKPTIKYTHALTTKPNISPNIPYTIDFNDDKLLKTQLAYRAFESSYQAIREHIAGNPSRAIRLKGSDQNKHIAFLPMMDKLTGQPVDFTKVKRIYFSYYLTKESDDFKGSSLFLAGKHWDDVLLDENFYSNFKKGSWHEASIDIANLALKQVRGNNPVMPNVYELRLDLNYLPGKKNIEMWLDNFGWE